MNIFSYHQASDPASAIALKQAGPAAKYLGGGTNLVDLMRETVEQPETLVDISHLPGTIEQRADGSLLIGAGVKNTALAAHDAIRANFPLLSRSILAGIRGIPAILRPAALDRCHDPPSRFRPLLAAVTQASRSGLRSGTLRRVAGLA